MFFIFMVLVGLCYICFSMFWCLMLWWCCMVSMMVLIIVISRISLVIWKFSRQWLQIISFRFVVFCMLLIMGVVCRFLVFCDGFYFEKVMLSCVSSMMVIISVSGRQWVSLFFSLVKFIFSIMMMNRNSMVIVLIQMMISSMVMNFVFCSMNRLVVEKKVRISYSIECIGLWLIMIMKFVMQVQIVNRQNVKVIIVCFFWYRCFG